MQPNLLMIEDDSELAEILTHFLKRYNITVTNYEDPYLGISALSLKKYDLLILDLSLPGMDGLEICKEVRLKNDIPIIISSARSDLEDKIIGLELGADDYLPKPYEPKELYARIMSVLRRYKKSTYPQEDVPMTLILKEESHTIFFQGTPLTLTPAEFDVLAHLIKKNNCVVSRAELLGSALSLNEENESRSLDVLISRIRTKLGESSKEPKLIHSVRGIGYRLQA
ncbi:response regulator transcription factor [Sulfurospirillum barnesii]|uniref:Response regulator with CheY-like receiver domain and winged-helix DNA-binding domain n=1 Tax=Sulfurospirillum barnesii (strain ATCC 700032 / DSM 10660 / SES-3) TaxID=760154 RepID=I3XZY6_SULBS|nr:response regulator transcription factor [Sulfurospirillum barnesii]AFL69510.1 response regulator with CheY-like receiver domain and winged-helix DNA-binding domain [Sulfurospirillum barnesii SES-3]